MLQYQYHNNRASRTRHYAQLIDVLVEWYEYIKPFANTTYVCEISESFLPSALSTKCEKKWAQKNL